MLGFGANVTISIPQVNCAFQGTQIPVISKLLAGFGLWPGA